MTHPSLVPRRSAPLRAGAMTPSHVDGREVARCRVERWSCPAVPPQQMPDARQRVRGNPPPRSGERAGRGTSEALGRCRQGRRMSSPVDAGRHAASCPYRLRPSRHPAVLAPGRAGTCRAPAPAPGRADTRRAPAPAPGRAGTRPRCHPPCACPGTRPCWHPPLGTHLSRRGSTRGDVTGECARGMARRGRPTADGYAWRCRAGEARLPPLGAVRRSHAQPALRDAARATGPQWWLERDPARPTGARGRSPADRRRAEWRHRAPPSQHASAPGSNVRRGRGADTPDGATPTSAIPPGPRGGGCRRRGCRRRGCRRRGCRGATATGGDGRRGARARRRPHGTGGGCA